jgi:RNA polymerase sigma-70 factor (ECF subfamily)
MVAMMDVRQREKLTGNDEQTLSDEWLLAKYRETGNRELFEQLVRRYERELFNYLRRYLGDAEMAEDVFQATFLQVHLKCDQFEVGRRFRPWLYTVATNQAIDARRRNRRHQMVSLDRDGGGNVDGDEVGRLVNLLTSDDQDPFDRMDAQERQRSVQETLEELPEHMHAVVQLVYYNGMKYREAADVLSIPVGTVKSRLHAAIAKLAKSWKRDHVFEA